MELLVLLGLILLNGLFAMSEIALVTARRPRLARLAADGDRAAVVAMELGENPTRFLSTIQIGITAIGILNGIIGEAVFAAPFATWLTALGLRMETAGIVATALVVVVITYVTIVVGELVPKRLGQLSPEPIARGVARPMRWLALVSQPFVRLLTFSTDSLLKLFPRAATNASETVTEEEIHALLEEGSEAGVIERAEHTMVRNVFRLDDRQLGSLMIPRADIVFLDVADPLEDNLRLVRETPHSRFPVCRGGTEDILGVMSMRNLFLQAEQGTVDLARNLDPPVYVPETLTGMELLEQFRASGTNMVLVIDEYGEIQGLVTLQDVFEAVIGEFRPRHADEAWAVQREDGSWLLDGLIPMPELHDRLGMPSTEDEERVGFQTLSGLVMWLLGRVPQTGDVATWQGWRLEVVDMDGKRIDKILATRIPSAQQAGEAEP